MNESKEVAAIPFFFFFFLPKCVLYCQNEAWLAVVTSLAIYAQTDDPDSRPIASWKPTLNPLLQQEEETSGEKKEEDFAASTQQSCRSIHQKMETNFLSVVVSPVDAIAVVVVRRSLHPFPFFIHSSFMPVLFYCCSIFYLAFY